ncbi:MAG: CocE/NonD family hydrolase [Thermoplasmatota archaeon]
MIDLKSKTIVVVLISIFLFTTFLAGCIFPTEYMVEMRDGVRLSTNVYVPRGQTSPHGSILIRTPYDKNKISIIGSLWARAGWATIIQDMRGRFKSEGIDTVFRNAHTDGPDTLEWIAEQSWSNGKIATFGGSALGINQYFMAGANPPNLACQYIQVATPNLHKHVAYQGGQFREEMVEIWLARQGSLHMLPELYAHENYTLDFWTNVTLDDKWDNVNVPAIHIGGWYDCMAQGTIDGFMGYQYLGGSGAQGKSKLIMGPWTHGGHTGQIVYPSNSKDTFSLDMFWDMVNQYTMNGEPNFDEWPTVTYYVMGDVDNDNAPGKEWRYADTWPLSYSETKWYFNLNNELTLQPPGFNQPVSYLYDPTNPVPTLGGQNLNIPSGAYDQRPVEDRDDVILFTSPVLGEPYEATGPIKAQFYVSSDCPDTDFTVKLSDVYPDGRSILITDGILRMRNRNGFDHWDFMNPGEIYEIEVDLWSTSYIWNVGHQIRVAISSSNYPRFKANPNTIDPIAANQTYSIAENTVYFDSLYQSCIILPEIAQPIPNDILEKPTIHHASQLRKRAGDTQQFIVNTMYVQTDMIYYFFDWDDESESGWMGPFNSDEEISIDHVWDEKGTYNVKVKARDSTGAISEWSEEVEIYLPFEKKITGEKITIFFEQRKRNTSNVEHIPFLFNYEQIIKSHGLYLE